MPSFFKHSPSTTRGVQKMPAHIHAHKQNPLFYGLKTATKSYLNSIVPKRWFSVPSSAPALAPAPPAPISSVFETSDCIWYYGTIYVKEAVAVEKLHKLVRYQEPEPQFQEPGPQFQEPGPQFQKPEPQFQEPEPQFQEPEPQFQEPEPHFQESEPQFQEPEPDSHTDCGYDDDDTESTTSGNGGTLKGSRNIGKINQLKHLKDGMRLRHMIALNHVMHEWFATFDAETNRIIRTPDGVAFETLRQFARVHSNEVVSDANFQCNVWSDAHFQYQDDVSGQWHPLSDLKKH